MNAEATWHYTEMSGRLWNETCHDTAVRGDRLMQAFAYCCKSFAPSGRKAAGVVPITCPPVTATSLDISQLENRRLLYFDLHGEPGEDYWLGDDGFVALTASQLRNIDLRGTIVFAVNCYLANQESPMLDALLDARAEYVIGGDGKNWAGAKTIFGASLLGLWFRRLLFLNVSPLKALAIAKHSVRGSMTARKLLGRKGNKALTEKQLAAKDTLEFRAYYRRRV